MAAHTVNARHRRPPSITVEPTRALLARAAGYRESHQARMVRKFGSAERFEAFKKRHGLVRAG